MVFFFTPSDPRFVIYMGRDKHENEELIRWGWPCDVWFHGNPTWVDILLFFKLILYNAVDNLSSAHVYLRLPEEYTVDTIPEDILAECCQLVKQNSIQGCKLNNVPIVYTPWSNLLKKGSMDVGQVGFHDNKLVKKTKVDRKLNAIVNRLAKTKREDNPNFRALKENYEREMKDKEKREREEQRRRDKELEKERTREKELRSYDTLYRDEAMESNIDMEMTAEEYEDDFM